MNRQRGIFLIAFALGSVAFGQGPSADAKSRALYREAQQTYDRGDLTPALALFLEAYEARPLPGFLFNIGQCHRQLANYERAAFYFKRYLELAPNTPNAAVVKDLIAEVEEKQAHLELERSDEAAAGRARELELAKVAAATAEADAAAKRQAELETRQQLELEAARRESELAAARALAEKPPPPVVAAPSILGRWYFWAGVGVVVAGATAGTVYAVTAPGPRPTTFGTDSAR